MTSKDNGGPAFPQPDLSGYGMGPVEGPNGQYQMNGMTLRAYAAIHLQQPDSGIDWLDAMILSAKRDAIAGQALTGLLLSSKDADISDPLELLATASRAVTDAMLAERSK